MAAATEPYVRIEGGGKVTGKIRYAADITRPGMLHGKLLRSPYPHARIVSIDTSKAKALPGVHAVLTGQDFPEHFLLGRSMRDMPVLARDKVRFFGEKVAAVAAESAEIAEEALNLIEVEYEELPAVYDPLEAIEPDAPLIHDPAWVRAHKTKDQKPADYPNSVSNPIYGVSVEELEAEFAKSAYVFEHEFRTPVQHQAYLEPHCCLVEFDERGIAHIYASNKAPFLLLDYLRDGVGITRPEVEVHIMPLGADFGGKGSFMDIPLAYFLAKESGRPVRILMSMTEELMAANPRHSAVIKVKTGYARDGKITARWVRTYYNSGAYAAFKPAVDATLPRVLRGALSAYVELPMYRSEGHMIYTNTVPCGHMRAPGGAQPVQAIEQHTDLCAWEMGIDPLDLRMVNAPTHPRHEGHGGEGTVPLSREALQVAAEAIGWRSQKGRPTPTPRNGKLVGQGVGFVDISNSPATDYTNRIIVQQDGHVVMHTPIVEQGSGMLTAFRLLVSEQWGVPLDEVEIIQSMDEDYDRGVGGSRITRVVGNMIKIMSEKAQDRLKEVLADQVDCNVSEVTYDNAVFQVPGGKTYTLPEVTQMAASEIVEVLRYTPRSEDSIETFLAVTAEVEVDTETGEIEVTKMRAAAEVGKIVNPIGHRGQIDGAIVQGMGYVLMEGLQYEEGRVTNLNLHEYKLPTMGDLPEFDAIILEPNLSLGLTPIGEGPNCGASAAIANAVMNALGKPLFHLPIKAEEVLEAIDSKS
jgi:CO/xanthine dehydrogenase Mo-binding subunit